MTEEQMVFEFITAFDAKPDWNTLVIEEAKEVNEAVEHLLKEIADLAYVLTGHDLAMQDRDYDEDPDFCTAIEWACDLGEVFGDEMLEEVFRRVHGSNMSKLDDNGKPIRREDGKVLKGPNYKPPVLSDLVKSI